MGERRMKDGKRGSGNMTVAAAGEAPAPRQSAWRPEKSGSVRRRGAGPKERRFVVSHEGRDHHVFDPETSLHVGRHYGVVGIVYRFREDVRRWIWGGRDEYSGTNTDRGLVPWDGTGGVDALRRAAACLALEKGKVTRPPEWMVDRLCRSGLWGRREFWEALVEAHKVAVEIGMVKEVMES